MRHRGSEVVDLLQQLIRNECVNDGTKASGHESKSVDLLDTYLAGSGADIERYEPEPGRGSLVAKIEGSDPSAPSLASTTIKAGPNDVERVSFTAPSTPGRYFFRCDVHPTLMTGFLVVN